MRDYQKEYESEAVGVCALGKTKTYMDYRSVTDPSSKQYWFIRENMEVDPLTGFLFNAITTPYYFGLISTLIF